jgi:tetratricopeptide (TPR) repeat protein
MKRSSVVLCLLLIAGCGSQPAPESQAAQTAPKSITFTSKSAEAIAQVQKGEALLDNLRPDEAAAAFAAALKLDPSFVLAQAEHGIATPGVDGLKELETAAASAKDVSEGERALIEALVAQRKGDPGAAVAALRRLTDAAPGYPRGHSLLGAVLLNQGKDQDGVASLRKAIELDPNDGRAQNMLGYAALRQSDVQGAIAAFEEYARLLPQEPNAQDSLGEALLAGGQFQEAEAAFGKAIALSPQFFNAHEGIAFARIYAGNWTGGREAMAQAKAAATRPGDQMEMNMELAAIALAQKNVAESLQILDATAKIEGGPPNQKAIIPVRRALTLIVSGRPREAFAPIADALKIVEGGQLPPGPTLNIRREALRARVLAEASLKDAMAAQKTSALLDMDASSRADDANAQTAMHFGRGLLAVAQGDFAGAGAHFKQCLREDEMCQWQALQAAEKAGDKAAAAALRDETVKLYRRTPLHLIIRSRLTPSSTS